MTLSELDELCGRERKCESYTVDWGVGPNTLTAGTKVKGRNICKQQPAYLPYECTAKTTA